MAVLDNRRRAARNSGIPFLPKVTVVAGAGSNTNIAVTGINVEDQILSVLQLEPDNGAAGTMLTDRTGSTSVTSAGNIQCTASTTGKQLLVLWYKVRR